MKLWDGPEQASIEVKIYNVGDLVNAVGTAQISEVQDWEHVLYLFYTLLVLVLL